MNTLLDSVHEVLAQGETLLLALDDDTYRARLPAAFGASVGGHVRHCLDHFRSLLDGLNAADIDYDARARDPRIENERDAALTALQTLRREFARLDTALLGRPVAVRASVSYQAENLARVASTVGREIMECVTHAVHHFALIGIMCGLHGVPLPEGFGVAPSTLRHQGKPLAAS